MLFEKYVIKVRYETCQLHTIQDLSGRDTHDCSFASLKANWKWHKGQGNSLHYNSISGLLMNLVYHSVSQLMPAIIHYSQNNQNIQYAIKIQWMNVPGCK